MPFSDGTLPLGRTLFRDTVKTKVICLRIENYLSPPSSFLQATVSGLHPNQPASVRISAVRAIFGFCDHLKKTDNKQALQPYIADMMDGLLAIAQQFSTEVLSLCLETLNMVLEVFCEFLYQLNKFFYNSGP